MIINNSILTIYNVKPRKYSEASKNLKQDISFDGVYLSRYGKFKKYSPAQKILPQTSQIPINIHNPEIAERIKTKYSSKTFAELFDFAKENGVFNINVNKETGIVKTFINTEKISKMSSNDKRMADNIWITDSCHNMELLKEQHPELCTKTLNTLAKLYKSEQKVFDEVIENPESYEKPYGIMKGIGHVFKPDGKVDDIYPKTRLESVGEYLHVASDLIESGLKDKQKYGYKKAADIPSEVTDSISNCMKYLAAINYPKAQACGAWEEGSFKGGMTSDTASINKGVRRVLGLMFSETTNSEILKFRQKVKNSKHGDVFEKPDILYSLLEKGEEKVRKNYLTEVPNVRDTDAAQAFLTHSEILDKTSVEKDINKHLEVLEKLEKNLVGENGIRRYNGDEYKNHNADINRPKWDCKNSFQWAISKIRRTLTPIQKHKEAEWFMVADISTGYGVQVQKLIQSKTPEELKSSYLLHRCLAKEIEFINRSYGQITPKNSYKANRKNCQGFSSPEAYQYVSTPWKIKQTKAVPGTNTPLAWSQSSRFVASKTLLENLKRLEELGIIT